MIYQPDFSDIVLNIDLLARGAWLTLALWGLALGFGLAAGLVLGVVRSAGNRWLSLPAAAYVEVFRNTPVLVQLVWFYFAFPVLTGWQMSGFAAAALGLSLNTSAYCAEIFRGGIGSIARGQWEAGRALGMGYPALMRRIVLPQAVRRMVPAFTNRGIELGKMTAIASVISVHELMYEARQLSATTFRPLEVFTVIAVLYFVVIYPGTWLSYRLEARLARRG
ncbi:amino acid ABC transporter membrane protein 2 (PAAT family) [Stella humosa]|uniref:Glutamate/aspartate import permease protein GltK n=1 Tax=Stella humosa TaxID=94 RepID=A0A3N1MC37_9PROT|nr:amino acid ABC transporter permease [Stella humosa]ROQ01283.1 amino acid ABC transporter membrane protein 2 (PAAT family) [Stella humosa]BBK31657.1 ABC transporter permease [Stella humosa]